MRYADTPGIAVELWRGNETFWRIPCVDAAAVATEADRLFKDCCPSSSGPKADP